MLVEFLLAILAGIIFGIFTGLIPGIHVNLITLILVVSLVSLEKFSPLVLAVFITSLAITHTFLDFIPSVFSWRAGRRHFSFGSSGTSNAKRWKKRTKQIVLTLYGSLAALLVIFNFHANFYYLIPIIYTSTKLFFVHSNFCFCFI